MNGKHNFAIARTRTNERNGESETSASQANEIQIWKFIHKFFGNELHSHIFITDYFSHFNLIVLFLASILPLRDDNADIYLRRCWQGGGNQRFKKWKFSFLACGSARRKTGVRVGGTFSFHAHGTKTKANKNILFVYTFVPFRWMVFISLRKCRLLFTWRICSISYSCMVRALRIGVLRCRCLDQGMRMHELKVISHGQETKMVWRSMLSQRWWGRRRRKKCSQTFPFDCNYKTAIILAKKNTWSCRADVFLHFIFIHSLLDIRILINKFSSATAQNRVWRPTALADYRASRPARQLEYRSARV